MGHILTREGHQPDPSKIEAIMKMQKPTNIARVRRLVGMVNYLARFLSHLFDICEPLRQLTKSSRHAMAMDTDTLSSIQVVEAILTHSAEREHVPHMHAVPPYGSASPLTATRNQSLSLLSTFIRESNIA